MSVAAYTDFPITTRLLHFIETFGETDWIMMMRVVNLVGQSLGRVNRGLSRAKIAVLDLACRGSTSTILRGHPQTKSAESLPIPRLISGFQRLISVERSL